MKPAYNKKSSGGWGGNRNDGGRDGGRSGGSSWGRGNDRSNGGRSWGRGNDRDGGATMHRSTCAECNKSCEVPFKPNGRKPVLCSDCFRGADGASKPSHFNNDRNDRSERSYEKPAYRSTPRAASSDDMAKQLKALNAKVDQILEILMDLDEEGDEDKGFDLEDEAFMEDDSDDAETSDEDNDAEEESEA